MNINIEDFLPKYPNIENKSTDAFMNAYDNNFNQNIYNKNEFFSLRLNKTEEKKEGELFNHQKIISRFLSTYTIYDGLLLVHEMGTGKSCAAFGAIEQIKDSELGYYKGAIVLTKGSRLGYNNMRELAFVCTQNKYAPDNSANEAETKRKIKKLTSSYYSFHTFDIFTKRLSKMSDEDIIKEYSNKIFMIDEVHNLRLYGKAEESRIYIQIHRLFHLIKNSKKIIMSGTPMKDDPTEIAAVLNLILPEDKQLPTGKDFSREFLVTVENGIELVKEDKKDTLKRYMKGRVSFLKAMSSELVVEYQGEVIAPLKYFIVYPSYMEKEQLDIYKKAYESDKREKAGLFSNSRQATLFGKSKKDTGLKLLKGSNNEETLRNLKKYSSTYGSIVESILKNPTKLTFVYNTFVEGSGSILLGKILELFGFRQARGGETTQGLRFAVLSSKTTNPVQTASIIKRFNSKDNLEGAYIQVIIGSRIISEGITLKNVQEIHIATPHWNYSELAQAIARGVRLISHEDLIEAGKSPLVKIYQHVALSRERDVKSIDLEMYSFCERKDISIKNIERLIKESAFDCALFYRRNRVDGKNNQRECEYQDCNYKCDGITELDNVNIDYSTFELYYSQEVIKNLIDSIKALFKIHFSYTARDLIFELRTRFNIFEIFTALKKIIYENIIIKNKYGFNNYVREENDIFFLVDNLSVDKYISSGYAEHPVLIIKENKNILEDVIIVPRLQEKIENAKTIEEFKKYMVLLPINLQKIYIELAIASTQQSPTRNFILEFFKANVDHTRYTIGDESFCLVNGVWGKCEVQMDEEPDVEYPYEYEGLYNDDNDMFCIKKITEGVEDTRSINTGKNCLSYNKKELMKVVNNLKIPFGENTKKYPNLDTMTKEELATASKLNKNSPETLDLNVMDEMKRILFHSDSKVDEICRTTKNWLEEQKILKPSKTCGVQGAKKKVLKK